MMKKILSTLFAVCTVFTTFASGQWTLRERTFDVDTVFHATVGPGTTQTSVYLTGPAVLHVFYTTIDLNNEFVNIHAVSGTDNSAGCENISSMAVRKSTDNAHYFAGVNADFFQTSGRVGEPLSNCIVEGEIFRLVNNGRVHFSSGKDWVDIFKTKFSAKISNGTVSKKVSGINKALGTNDLALFTSRYASKTVTAEGVAEVTIKPVEGVVKCGTTKFVVTSAPVTTGGSAIPAGECVLAGSSSNVDFVSGLKEGDELTLTLNITSDGKDINDIVGQVGGLPEILHEGEILGTEASPSLLDPLHPRTAIGYNADRTKLVMLVVDGRGVSAGVSSPDLAAIMLNTGCSYAMNLDGGGSSSLYIEALGTRNKPSDGKERAVANGVFAVANCPVDKTPETIEFVTKAISLPRYSYYTPTVYAYNKYGVLIDTDFKGYTLSCDDDFGTVTDDGKSLLCNGTGYKALRATYGDCTTSIPVKIVDASPRFRLSSVVVDPYNAYTSELVSTIGGVDSPVDNSVMTWSSEDSNIAAVDNLGNITAVSKGETVIHAVLDAYDLTLSVKVEVPTTRYISLFGDAALTLAKSSLKSDATVTKTDNGFDLDFTISAKRGTYAGVKTNVNTYAIPDSIRMSVNPGTASITKVVFSYVGYDGRTKYATFTPEFTENTTVDLLFPVKEIVDNSLRESFPINFTGVNFYLNNSASSTHKISVKSLNQVYDSVKESGGVETVQGGNENFILAPNPVNPCETVSLGKYSRFAVYSLAGVKVNEGEGTHFTAPEVKGVYVVSVEKSSQKLIVK